MLRSSAATASLAVIVSDSVFGPYVELLSSAYAPIGMELPLSGYRIGPRLFRYGERRFRRVGEAFVSEACGDSRPLMPRILASNVSAASPVRWLSCELR
jgi:hypothetical protein